jgi:1-deoxy-D-xylulose-5-phosphate reductoisomerase
LNIRQITILGSTGSIGLQSLDVCEKLNIKIAAIGANKNIELLEQQARKYLPVIVSVTDEKSAAHLKQNLKDISVKVVCGVDGLCEAASYKNSDLVLNAVVGVAGLMPSLAAIRAKKNIALANKESLVTGGELIINEAKNNHVTILPVDSEHSAIFQCLQGCTDVKKELKSIILTASGGPFYGYSKKKLKDITPAQALNHPNWLMGNKISIDCATLMNKGLELIEAVWLFGLQIDQVKILVHRQSIVHSMVEFKDNSIIAQLGSPDMRIPIQYAITYPERLECPVEELDLLKIKNLTFENTDEKTFKCLKACKDAIKSGGLKPVAANAANEVAVELFLRNKIGFLEIGDIVEDAIKHQVSDNTNITLEKIMSTDLSIRAYVKELVNIKE